MIRLLFNKHSNSIRCLFVNQESTLINHLRFIHNNTQIPIKNQPSFTASYLIDFCGLSPQSALSAAKKITIRSTENADSVISLFKSYGFSDTQITKLVVKLPLVLCSDPGKTIRPKLDYFLDVAGFSSTQLAAIISSQPQYLLTSLEKRIKPNFDLLKSVFHTKQQMATAISGSSWLLRVSLETNFLPNVRELQLHGAPDHNIAKIVALYPRFIVMTTDLLKENVKCVVKMGFDPSSTLFVLGVAAMSSLSPLSWERKVDVYKSVGWSEAEFISAFTRNPHCVLLSEENIRQTTDFLAKKMYWGSSFISRYPVVLGLSLKKRISPRCSVISLLSSKGLVKNELKSCSFLKMTDKKFLDKYVTKYADRVPKVLAAFSGN